MVDYIDIRERAFSDKKRIESVMAEVFGDAKYRIKNCVSFYNKMRVSVVYWDYLPEREVMKMIGDKLPGVEVLLGRDYDIETMKKALMEMCDNEEYVWCYDMNEVPFLASPFDIAAAWLANKSISYSKEDRGRGLEDKIDILEA